MPVVHAHLCLWYVFDCVCGTCVIPHILALFISVQKCADSTYSRWSLSKHLFPSRLLTLCGLLSVTLCGLSLVTPWSIISNTGLLLVTLCGLTLVTLRGLLSVTLGDLLLVSCRLIQHIPDGPCVNVCFSLAHSLTTPPLRPSIHYCCINSYPHPPQNIYLSSGHCCMHVHPQQIRTWFTSAFSSTSKRTAPAWPFCAAMNTGDRPSFLALQVGIQMCEQGQGEGSGNLLREAPTSSHPHTNIHTDRNTSLYPQTQRERYTGCEAVLCSTTRSHHTISSSRSCISIWCSTMSDHVTCTITFSPCPPPPLSAHYSP